MYEIRLQLLRILDLPGGGKEIANWDRRKPVNTVGETAAQLLSSATILLKARGTGNLFPHKTYRGS